MNPTSCTRTADGHYLCRYCGQRPMRVRGGELFPDHPEAAAMHYLNCRPCKAFVRCADGGWEPLGELGDPSVRRVRKAARDAYEGLVQRTLTANRWPEEIVRAAISSWMGSLDGPTAPIAGLDSDDCTRLMEICSTPSPPLGIHVYRVSQAAIRSSPAKAPKRKTTPRRKK